MLAGPLYFGAAGAAENPADTYDYRAVCPKPAGGGRGPENVDKWSFYKCECTSYVADKLNERGVKFNNYYKGVRWSNAANWRDAAKKVGISTGNAPKKGSVAWLASSKGAKDGHVAYVEEVNKDGTITISEYNWPLAHDYGRRTKVKANAFSAFIYF